MTRDQFLCEMMGEMWHYFPDPDNTPYCVCGAWYSMSHAHQSNPNFSLWPDKGRLLDFVMAQDWWGNFEWTMRAWYLENTGNYANLDHGKYITFLIDNLADLVAEYRGWKE